MKRILITGLFVLYSTTCFGADRITYSTAELQVSGKNNVTDIVAQFVEDTDRTEPVEPDQLMFLVDGRSVSSLGPHLPESDRVEVMSDGTSVVINVVSEPEADLP